MTYLILGAVFVAAICGARATFWILHVTSDRDEQ